MTTDEPTTDAIDSVQRDDDTGYFRMLLQDLTDPESFRPEDVASAMPTTLAEAGYMVQLGRSDDTFFARVAATRLDGRTLKLDAVQPITDDRDDVAMQHIDRIALWSDVLRRIIAWWETGTDAAADAPAAEQGATS